MTRYTVAMCCLNMADTVERAIRSIDRLVTDEFEILVLDDGSNDGTADILDKLADELPAVRVIHDDNPNIGAARASAVGYARGDYILPQLDADDVYQCCIGDFVEIFHQIESQVDFDPFLSGQHIHVGSTGLLRAENYRPVGYNEDRDLWRRMLARGSFVGLLHRPIKRSIGYDRSGLDRLTNRFEALVTQFRTGVSPRSYPAWLARKTLWEPGVSRPAVAFNVVALLPAAALATAMGRYPAPPGYEDIAVVERELLANIHTLEGTESRYRVDIDRSRLTSTGRRVFDIDSNGRPPPRLWLDQPAPVAAAQEVADGR